MEVPTTQRDAVEVPPLPCLCASLRRAARAISQLYDRELRTAGLRSTQHTLLQVLAGNEGIAQKHLGELLALDTSTLSRTLRPLEKRGWIRSLPGKDLRQRRFALTPRGRRQVERGRPHWERAQKRVRTQLRPAEWEQVMAALVRVTRAAAKA